LKWQILLRKICTRSAKASRNNNKPGAVYRRNTLTKKTTKNQKKGEAQTADQKAQTSLTNSKTSLPRPDSRKGPGRKQHSPHPP